MPVKPPHSPSDEDPTWALSDHAVVISPVEFGEDVYVYPGCVIGCPAESRTLPHDPRYNPIEVGARTVLREHAVVQRGLERGTKIGEDCYIMHGAHIAHDVWVEGGVTISPTAVLGGHTTVMRGANIGIGAMVHQHVTVGSYSMVGMGAVVVHDVPPGMIVAGNPARILRTNQVGLERHGIEPEQLAEELERFHGTRTRGLCRERE